MENKIKKAIQKGIYEIKLESDCHCCFNDWVFNGDRLIPDLSYDACWVGKVLYVDGEPVLQNIVGEPIESLVDDIDVEELLQEMDRYDILEQMSVPDDEENESHTKRQYESLVEWLQERIEEGKKLYIHHPRNFGNEYTCIIAAADAEIDDNWDEVSLEEWAEWYLKEDTPITEYSIGYKEV